MTVSTAAPLVRLLARERDPARLIAALHRAACELTGATSSVLLGPGPHGHGWVAASAAGLETLALGPWLDDECGAGAACRAVTADAPLVIRELRGTMPDLSDRLGEARSAVIVPLGSASEPLGMLVLGCRGDGTPDPEATAAIGDAFVVALERAAATSDLALSADVRVLMDALAREGTSPEVLGPALDAFCRGVVRLAGADGARIWLHDRRARELTCAASADTRSRRRPDPIATADQVSPVAAALRREGAELWPAAAGAPLATAGVGVGLKGRRRALGVLTIEGVRLEPGGERTLLDRSREIGRQLSTVLENVQLLDDVLRSRAALQNVFDSLADMVMVISAEGRLTDVNGAAVARLGQPRAALVDRRFNDVLAGPLLWWVSDAIGSDAAPLEGHVDDEAMGGRFEVRLTAVRSGGPGPHGWVLVARDVTVATRLDRERAELEHRLARSEKMLALGQFVAGVAHELNNPLQGVMGHLELVRASGRVPPPLARDLALVYREAGRAARIVRHLLLFAGSGRLRRRRVSINRVVARVLQLRGRALRSADIEVVRELEPGLGPTHVDSVLLQQALLNLVVNAEQAMAGAGRLLVRTQAQPGGVRISIRDSGPGMTDQVRSRLFEPFFTTKEEGAGTGLGLAIAYGIVTAHGGQIEVTSTAGSGACFEITLPQVPQAREPE